MKAWPTAALLAVTFSSGLRADFGYQVRTEIAGGTMVERTKPVLVEHLIKDKRMAAYTKEHDTVLNLENETVYEIDFSKKTYYSMTFARIRETFEKVMKSVDFEASAHSGGTKTIGILAARETIATMTSKGPQDLKRIFLDYWSMTPPGFAEMQDFRRQVAAKLGYVYAAGLSGIAMEKPELFAGFEEAAKALIQADEMPVEVVLRLGTAGEGDLAPVEPAAKTGIVGETLGRVGKISHRKNGASEDNRDPSLSADVRIELSGFGAGPADESKFNVPGGYKEIKPPAAKP